MTPSGVAFGLDLGGGHIADVAAGADFLQREGAVGRRSAGLVDNPVTFRPNRSPFIKPALARSVPVACFWPM